VVADKEEHEPLFARENRPDRILWRNWAVLREALQIPSTVPVRFLKVINDPALKADNQHHLTIHQIPNRHAEYIATWFSLATFSAIMSFIRK
jgi:cytochrome oxidase assembly protein ShyY1